MIRARIAWGLVRMDPVRHLLSLLAVSINSSAVRSSPRSDATRARPTTAIALRGSSSTACQ